MKKFLTAILLVVATGASAQKQLQVQDISVRAPDNVKIEGKIGEWPNPFLNANTKDAFLTAYNSASRIYYTLANDDNNLYLTIRGLGTAAAQKILKGGLAFTISHATDKKLRVKAVDNVVVMFPVPQDDKTVADIMGPIFSLNGVLNDTVANRRQIDSIVSLANKRVSNAMKEIRVVGIKEIPDSSVSIYNTEGIKAGMGFIKRMPTIELAIPLKYLKLSVNDQAPFSYNIKLTGMTLPAGVQIDPDIDINAMYGISVSDFWGTYTLAKKP